MCANLEAKNQDLKSVSGVQYDGELQTNARAPSAIDGNDVTENNGSGDETVIKKRKTRRGKPKRRNTNPYSKPTWQQRKNLNSKQTYKFNRKFRTKILAHGQAFAPYNSNQFLMEDHGNLQELDDKLNKSDGAGTSLHPPRTRDSSFSVDSDAADFYSSPEDEEEFLTKEFDNAYEDLHAERLQSMSKDELIDEYLQLENRVDMLTNRLKGKSTNIGESNENKSETLFREEMNRLMIENEDLRRENEMLRSSGVCRSPLSSSVDSESDSSTSTCNSSSSSEAKVEETDTVMTPTQTSVHSDTNGFSPHPQSPNVV